MFIGSINRYMRAVLEQTAQAWKGLPVHVACSGNFTVERILARAGVGAIHSNDVSIYSCALGWHLAGKSPTYTVKEQAGEFAWLGDYLAPGPATIATLLLTGEMLKAGGERLQLPRRPLRNAAQDCQVSDHDETVYEPYLTKYKHSAWSEKGLGPPRRHKEVTVDPGGLPGQPDRQSPRSWRSPDSDARQSQANEAMRPDRPV